VKQLNLIPQEKASYKKAAELQKQANMTQQFFAPIKELADKLSAFSTNPNYDFSKDQRDLFSSKASEIYAYIESASRAQLTQGGVFKPDDTFVNGIKDVLINGGFDGDTSKYKELFQSTDSPIVYAINDQTSVLLKMLEYMSGSKEDAIKVADTLGLKSKLYPEAASNQPAFTDYYKKGIEYSAKTVYSLATLAPKTLALITGFDNLAEKIDKVGDFLAKQVASAASYTIFGDIPLEESKALGGSIGTLIKGPGTGTSDSIRTKVPSGSYVIQSKYA
jgi:hypothetical protein